ncbi:MAG: pseudouridine synthase [Planctomycetota bacterium]|nr:pseudouridine synthase [Planctomycetota bacterium]
MEFDPQTILFHGHGLVAVDKPIGVPVHRGTGHDIGVTDLLGEWVSLNPGVLDVRPGSKVHPVHRLDLEASGVLLLAVKTSAARNAKKAFEARTVSKSYLALVAGPMPAEGELKGKIRSKLRGSYRQLPASLRFRRLRGDERMSLVEVIPEGGRTHQIRALMARSGRPLAGDLRYGKPKPARQFRERFGMQHFLLHSWRLGLPGDVAGPPLLVEAPLPEGFSAVIEQKGWAALEQDPAGEWIAAD